MTLRRIDLLSLATLVLCATTASAAPVTYRLQDWGHYLLQTQLQGSITVDDADGNRLIEPGELVDWSFTGTVIQSAGSSPTLLPFTLLHEPGAQAQCRQNSCFRLDGQELVLDIRTQGPTQFTDSAGNRVSVAGDAGLGGDAVAGDWVATLRWSGPGTVGTSSLSLIPETLMRIAVTDAAVPEPSSWALWLAALAATAATATRRRAKGAAARTTL